MEYVEHMQATMNVGHRLQQVARVLEGLSTKCVHVVSISKISGDLLASPGSIDN